MEANKEYISVAWTRTEDYIEIDDKIYSKDYIRKVLNDE